MYFLEDNKAVQKIAQGYLNGFAAAVENHIRSASPLRKRKNAKTGLQFCLEFYHCCNLRPRMRDL